MPERFFILYWVFEWGCLKRVLYFHVYKSIKITIRQMKHAPNTTSRVYFYYSGRVILDELGLQERRSGFAVFVRIGIPFVLNYLSHRLTKYFLNCSSTPEAVDSVLITGNHWIHFIDLMNSMIPRTRNILTFSFCTLCLLLRVKHNKM